MSWMEHPTEGLVPEMATPEEIDDLQQAPPEEADVLFLRLMIVDTIRLQHRWPRLSLSAQTSPRVAHRVHAPGGQGERGEHRVPAPQHRGSAATFHRCPRSSPVLTPREVEDHFVG